MFVFLDESGRLDSYDDIKRPTIAAVLIPETSLSQATRELLHLKKDLCPPEVNPKEFELKSSKILRASSGAWKIELAERFFTQYLHSIPGLKVIAVVCRRPSRLLPKINDILPLHHIWLIKKVYNYMDSNFPEGEIATFIYDSQSADGQDERLSKAFTNFLYRHVEGQKFLKRIAPFPLFGNSSLICGIELADMIAGCLSRQADLYENRGSLGGRMNICLSRYTRYKKEIEKVQAEFQSNEGNEWAIQYVKEDLMERVLKHALSKHEDIDFDSIDLDFDFDDFDFDIKPEDIEKD